MGKMTRKLVKRGKAAARKAYDRLESKVMAAVGRKAVKTKMKSVKIDAKIVAKRAAKKALIAGGLAAAGVVAKEIQARRKKKPA